MRDLYGFSNGRAVKKLEKIAKLVEQNEEKYTGMTDEELSAQTQVLKDRFANGETLDDLLPDAYAVCREASKRVLNMRHFHVQILGGIALHQGRIAQLATGEGKTLMETLPAYLNAISGQGVHIITVNEYLATRDRDWMGKVFRFLGLTVGVTLSNQSLQEKRAAYACDITYGTNSEFGFDYLRDNMSKSRDDCVQRGLNFVIVDEVDSILIDEARTPLIISGPSGKSSEMYATANRFACTLVNSTNVDEEGKPLNDEDEPNGDYVVDRKQKNARLTERGIQKAERFFKLDNLSDPENTDINHYINNALKAHAIMHRDDDYIVQKGIVYIVDSFTGRKMEGRRFSGGLHQAIEAKERVTIKEENKTFATITLQNYFRMYRKLSGMTGTAKTEEAEFNTIYNIDVVAIPTNLPMIREDRHDLVYVARQSKLQAIVKEIKERNSVGQPVLVGTVTVEKSEELSQLLNHAGIKHNVLNAKNHKREAEIIAQAGRFGSVTIATNMAGRGTDILLGGNPEFLAKKEMKRLGYEEEQIEASTSFAKGDEETEKLKQVYADLVTKYKAETDAEKQKVIEVGGLCVIGTERHDSRRIDNQLRGRAGRQGDPGCSVFYLSTEDDMIRVFGNNDMIRRFVALAGRDRKGNEGFIEHPAMSKVVEVAQKRIEGMHFSSRKNVLQYDDVNNQQRKAIYKERNRILDNENIHDDIIAMTDEYARLALAEACDSVVDVSQWDLDKVNEKLSHYFTFEQPILTADNVQSARQVCDMLAEQCRDYFNKRAEESAEDDFPFTSAERFVLLTVMDNLWIDHLDALDDLRQGIGLQAIGQHDPVMAYKKEAFDMFEKLNEQIKLRTLHMLTFGRVRQGLSLGRKKDENINPERTLNGPCPCGSGKKYKNCCYAKDMAKEQGEQPDEQQNAEPRPMTKQEEYALK
ncbi:MAG: preprotein translocase subunit SecA, partial [Clostridia bacterium]|nr:preprotein translocase subunit SecA [Clostridia bacterium]